MPWPWQLDSRAPNATSNRGYGAFATKPERIQRVQTRTRFREPPIVICTFCRFGRCWLLVLIFEWLTLLATRLCLPQIAHCAGMSSPEARTISTY
jgi:hypothetical protein